MAGKKNEKATANSASSGAAAPGASNLIFTSRTRKAPKTGRPCKLDPKVTERLILALQAGNTYQTACVFAGIGYSTLRRWIAQAEEDVAAELQTDFREFWEALTRAQAEAEIFHVALIREAAQGGKPRRHVRTTKNGVVIEETELTAPDWRASAFILERRFANTWGKTVTQKIDWQPRSVDEMDEAELDAYEQELQALKARLLGTR